MGTETLRLLQACTLEIRDLLCTIAILQMGSGRATPTRPCTLETAEEEEGREIQQRMRLLVTLADQKEQEEEEKEEEEEEEEEPVAILAQGKIFASIDVLLGLEVGRSSVAGSLFSPLHSRRRLFVAVVSCLLLLKER